MKKPNKLKLNRKKLSKLQMKNEYCYSSFVPSSEPYYFNNKEKPEIKGVTLKTSEVPQL